ncbi:MAG: uppP [Bacteroidota bacterium]|nr:uppP [Bacteroidota bacterium]
MTIIQAILIAILEGLTEFLPISSTAHMKFLNPLIGVQSNSFSNLFEIVIQFAAILAVVVLFWRKFFDFKNIRFYLKLIVAVIPALIFGALLKKHIDSALSNLTFMAIVMICGGILLLFVDKWFAKNQIDDERKIDYPTALKIGLFQVLSILFPGLSRSAATIIGGMSQKLTRRAAAEFSFFLAVPTMFAASAKSLWDVHKEGSLSFSHNEINILLLGCLVSFIVATITIKIFIQYLKDKGFKLFGIYRIILGSVVLLFLLLK